MKGKITLIMLVFLVMFILLSEFVELMVYWFSDSSSFFESIGTSSFMKINRLLTLIALPVFVVVIVVGVDRIEKVDKYLLIGTTIFYVVVRIILLEFAIVFDYQNIAVDDYFNAKFYTHFILSVISFAIMFGAIYYVLNYKLELHRNWIVFFGMIIVDQVVVFTYQIVLVYLFNRNFSVSGEFYKGVMVFPVFMLTLVSAMATIMFKETRTRIIKLFNAV